ncbi:hypothetical protein FRC04_003900, partial [Tulasnella sp. 424]
TDLKAAELKITYVVNGASWTPAYEIRASTNTDGQLHETVALHYKAAVTQNTGEDWKNTKLTLNTTSPALVRNLLPHTGLKIQPEAATDGQTGGYPHKLNRAGLPMQQMQQHQQQRFVQQPTVILYGQPPIVPGAQTLYTGQPVAVQHTGQLFGEGIQNQPSGESVHVGGIQPQYTGVPQHAEPVQAVQIVSSPYVGQPTYITAAQGQQVIVPAAPTPPFPPAPTFGAPQEPAQPTAVIDEAAAFNYADAVAESTAVSATYKIEGKTTILSGIATHKVVISTSTVLPIEVYVVTMPRVQPWACLQAKIKNARAESLLAGHASIFNDDSYVSSTQLPLVSPGDSFICSLGMDDKIKVSFTHTDGKTVINNVPFVGNTESVLGANAIKVKNNRNGAISRLIIRDAVPVGQDPLKVLLKTPAELATVATADAEVKIAEGAIARWSKEKADSREEGLVEWVLDNIESGEEKKVELAWSVEVPQGFKWSYSV